MPSLIPRVSIDLDKPRTMTLTYRVFRRIEQALGGTPYYELFQPGRRYSATEVVVIVWATLLDDDPQLTLDAVEEMLTPQMFPLIIGKLDQLLTEATPETPQEPSNGNLSATDPQRPPEITGSGSGPSPVMTSVLAREHFGS